MKQDKLQKEFADKGFEFFKKQSCGVYHVYQRFGKIRTTLLLLENYKNPKVLICYPQNLIKQSWEDDVIKWKYNNPNVEFVNFSSLKKHLDKKYDFFILDEIQMLADSEHERENAQTIQSNSKYTLGLSGTLSKETQSNIKEWFGMKIIQEYSSDEAIADGIVADYRLTIHKVSLDNVKQIKDSKGKLKTEKKKFDDYSYVIEKLRREGKQTMFLTLARNRLSQNSISKFKKVKELLQQRKNERLLVFSGLSKIADSYGIPSYHSKTDEKNFEDFLEGRINHLALAVKGFVGKSYKALDGVILSNFVASEEALSQCVARAVLLDYTNKVAKIDIITLDEPNEIKKLNKALNMINPNKIFWK